MFKRSLILAVLAIGGVSPAMAAFCTDDRGFVVTFGIHVGEEFTEEELNEFDLMQLRRMGVDAVRVERWNGCIRAFVAKPGGGEEMQFFNPNTFERVQ